MSPVSIGKALLASRVVMTQSILILLSLCWFVVARREALEAVSFAIDEIKARVPIWKLEQYAPTHDDQQEDSMWKANAEFDAASLVASQQVPSIQ